MHKYQILDIIDQGAYGIVWKAMNKQTQQIVAIKQFKQNDEDQLTKRTIQRQIKMLKMLKGDYIVGLKQAFKKKGKIYLIFQYFPKNLLNLIDAQSQGIKPDLIKQVIYQIIKCLKFLHNKNILHRDIKPQNILLSDNHKQLKLCDLGFARFIPQNLKEMTQYVATRWYRSPQLLVGQPYGKPSDIFAVGCILGQLIDGQPMFPGENQIDQIFLLKKYIGQLTSNQHRCLFDNHKFSNVQIPVNKKKQTLQERYLGKIQRNALLFMKACLKMDPRQRLTVEQALKHPYLHDLSLKYKQFDNDQQNLMSQNRHILVKNDSSRNIIGFINKLQDQQSRVIFKNKSLTKKQSNLAGNYGSVDYGSLKSEIKRQKNLSNFSNHDVVTKKSSHQDLTSLNDRYESQLVKTKSNFTKKALIKNMSQQKHLKVNLDVNVNINFKINKKNQDKNKANIIDTLNNKLPQLKNNQKGSKSKQTLFGINKNRKWGEKNNLSIFGQSKQISNQLLTKKLGNLAN